eukprot:UN28912
MVCSLYNSETGNTINVSSPNSYCSKTPVMGPGLVCEPEDITLIETTIIPTLEPETQENCRNYLDKYDNETLIYSDAECLCLYEWTSSQRNMFDCYVHMSSEYTIKDSPCSETPKYEYVVTSSWSDCDFHSDL